MECKVDENTSCFHRGYITGVSTVRGVVPNKLIFKAKYPADGWREFKIFEINIYTRTQLVVVCPLLHPENLPCNIIICNLLVTVKI